MTKFNKNQKPVIGFDMDGVILDNSRAKIKIAKKLGFSLEPHHTPSEIIRTILPQPVLEELQTILYDDHRIKTPLMKGVKKILAELKSKKFPIFLISRRKMPEVAVNMLKEHKLWPHYFNGRNAYFVSDPKDKNKMAAKLGVTHYIDDELKIINVLSRVPNKFLFDQFNVFEKADHYTKIQKWPDFKKHFLKNV